MSLKATSRKTLSFLWAHLVIGCLNQTKNYSICWNIYIINLITPKLSYVLKIEKHIKDVYKG